MTTAVVESLKIERTIAEKLAMYGGWKSYHKWDNARLAEKLKTIKDVRGTEPPADEEVAALLIDVEAALERGGELEVYTAAAPEKASEEAAAAGNNGEAKNGGAAVGEQGGTKTPAEEPAAPPQDKAAARAAEKAKKEEEKAKAKADKEAAKKAKEEEAAKAKAAKEADKKAKAEEAEKDKSDAAGSKRANPKSIRPTASRAYYAGVLLKKYGLEKGITPEILSELDAMFGKANLDQSWSRLATGWHVLNGFLGVEGGGYAVDETKKSGS